MNSREKSQSAAIPMAQSFPGDAVADAATTPAPLLGAGGRTISEAIVTRLVATFDGACILGTGFAAMHWRSAAIDWHLEALVVLLGTVLGLNLLGDGLRDYLDPQSTTRRG